MTFFLNYHMKALFATDSNIPSVFLESCKYPFWNKNATLALIQRCKAAWGNIFPSKWAIAKSIFPYFKYVIKNSCNISLSTYYKSGYHVLFFSYQSPRSLFSKYLWLEKLSHKERSTENIHCSHVHKSEDMQITNTSINTAFWVDKWIVNK